MFGELQFTQPDEKMLASIAISVVARGARLPVKEHVEKYVDGLALGGTESILDLGCGAGMLARALARRSGYSGPITAVDSNARLVGLGRHLAREEGTAERIDFRWGDAGDLSRSLKPFDIVILHTFQGEVAGSLARGLDLRRLLRTDGKAELFNDAFALLAFEDNETGDRT